MLTNVPEMPWDGLDFLGIPPNARLDLGGLPLGEAGEISVEDRAVVEKELALDFVVVDVGRDSLRSTSVRPAGLGAGWEEGKAVVGWAAMGVLVSSAAGSAGRSCWVWRWGEEGRRISVGGEGGARWVSSGWSGGVCG